jgi:hypothetical protein
VPNWLMAIPYLPIMLGLCVFLAALGLDGKPGVLRFGTILFVLSSSGVPGTRFLETTGGGCLSLLSCWGAVIEGLFEVEETTK